MIKDYKAGVRFLSEGQIVKVVKNNQTRACDDCVFGRENSTTIDRCLSHACSYRIFTLSRLNKLIFWKKK